ncbi:MAG: putative fluoride ion transporter CrcB 1 [Geminicoccaceae bacterium]|jgi:CrcB protein|nr:MAG: putative fluoride ion transporter CrcB 1 [Geminicoccaceae bacterium]
MRLTARLRRLPVGLWVGLGSAAGGLARWLVGLAFGPGLGLPPEAGTWFANVTGSWAIGLWAALTGPDGRLLVGTRRRQLVATGLCGGYTTFSMFGLETVTLVREGRLAAASVYVAASLVGWMLAVWAGWTMGERLARPRSGRRVTGRRS